MGLQRIRHDWATEQEQPWEERGVEEAGNLCKEKEENQIQGGEKTTIPTAPGGHADRWSEWRDHASRMCVFVSIWVCV